jgi:hypothetical protein
MILGRVVFEHDDDASQECFRNIVIPQVFFKDHALLRRGRYSLILLAKDDYGLGQKDLEVLVVTDPRYPQEISYIQRYSMICGQI